MNQLPHGLKASTRLALTTMVAGALFGAACSSSGGDGGGSGGGNINVYFSKAYSAVDGAHTFKVPVKAGVTGVTWTASDPNLVDIEALDDAGSADGSEAILLPKGAGVVTITAKAGSLSGSAVLTITQGTAAAYEIGRARYNDGQSLRAGGMGMPGGVNKEAACTNCHGPGSQDVEHSPTQIGGYTDAEVIGIFTMGVKPAGAKQRIIADAAAWSRIHQWQMTEEEKLGVLLYLRGIEPASQGATDFGGAGVFRSRPDGGFPGGNGPRGDGGMGRRDGGTNRDAEAADAEVDAGAV